MSLDLITLATALIGLYVLSRVERRADRRFDLQLFRSAFECCRDAFARQQAVVECDCPDCSGGDDEPGEEL